MTRVLIVDDDVDMREMLVFALQDLFEVKLAANGLQALRRLERERFDAVLLDLSMPVLDGRDVIREMRRRGLDTPVVLLSAEIGLATIAAQLQVREFLTKPVALHDLRETLTRTTAIRPRRPLERTYSLTTGD